jgi:hypothetical protein
MKSLTDERKVSSGRFFLDSENMIEYTVIQPEWKLCKRPYDFFHVSGTDSVYDLEKRTCSDSENCCGKLRSD